MKNFAERLMEKVEIIGLNLINCSKFRTKTEERLEEIEKVLPKCFTVDGFREESQLQEERVFKFINDRLGDF